MNNLKNFFLLPNFTNHHFSLPQFSPFRIFLQIFLNCSLYQNLLSNNFKKFSWIRICLQTCLKNFRNSEFAYKLFYRISLDPDLHSNIFKKFRMNRKLSIIFPYKFLPTIFKHWTNRQYI